MQCVDTVSLRDDAEFNRHAVSLRPLLMRYALRLTRSVPDAEDLVQTALFKAYKSKERIRTASEAMTYRYLCTIVRNEYIDLVRYRSRHPETLFTEYEQIDESGRTYGIEDGVGVSMEDSIIDGMDFGTLNERIRAMLARMSSRKREAFLMHYVEGYTVEEIAVRLGVPPGTVRTNNFRTRETLRMRLPRLTSA